MIVDGPSFLKARPARRWRALQRARFATLPAFRSVPLLAAFSLAQPPQAGAEIPFDETHLHYGKGQTEASVTLAPGKHTLTLQFANALHKRRA